MSTKTLSDSKLSEQIHVEIWLKEKITVGVKGEAHLQTQRQKVAGT